MNFSGFIEHSDGSDDGIATEIEQGVIPEDKTVAQIFMTAGDFRGADAGSIQGNAGIGEGKVISGRGEIEADGVQVKVRIGKTEAGGLRKVEEEIVTWLNGSLGRPVIGIAEITVRSVGGPGQIGGTEADCRRKLEKEDERCFHWK